MAAPVLATEAEEGTVVFRVTLEGNAEPMHTFAVSRLHVNAINSAELVCGPPTPSEPLLPLCSATTYEVTVSVPNGETIEYELLRWTTSDLSSDHAERYLAGELVVQGGHRHAVSLGYVYPGGDLQLPDTAIPPPSRP